MALSSYHRGIGHHAPSLHPSPCLFLSVFTHHHRHSPPRSAAAAAPGAARRVSQSRARLSARPSRAENKASKCMPSVSSGIRPGHIHAMPMVS